MIGNRTIVVVLLAGWLADTLARPDGDVEAGIEAYESAQYEAALEHFDAAIERRGDQPELSFNRGLVLLAQGNPEEARRAFERASEADDAEIRASAFYARGNVAFDTEDWDGAIESYIECLLARPDHTNAKWNLELARLRQKDEQDNEDEDEQDNEDEPQDEPDDGGTGGDQDGGSDETGGDNGSSSDDGGSSGGDDGGSSGGDDGGSSGGGESGGSDEPESSPQNEEPNPDESAPQPLDQMDIQRALEELDEQDHFPLDRPPGGSRPPVEDW